MDSIPKFSGYYVDSDTNHYNTFGQINNEWKDGVRYYIDVYKKVTLEGNYLAEAMSKTTGDQLYEPIGSRVEKNLMNMVMFGRFSIVKLNSSTSADSTLNLNSSSTSASSNEYGVLLSGGIKISLNPKEDDNQSNIFYKNYSDIKTKFNQCNTITVGSIFGENAYFELPGLDNNESLKVLNDNPVMFIDSYCRASNQDYSNLKQYIIKMHSIFNILSWCFEGRLVTYPGLILIIARAYHDINQSRVEGGQSKLEYFLTLPCDLDGLNQLIVNSWEKNYLQVFTDSIYQKPMSLGFLTCTFNPILFQQSYDGNNVMESIVNAPFSSGSGVGNGRSIDVVKSLLGSTDISYVKSRSFIIVWINHYEPSNSTLKKEIATFIDERFIKELSQLVLLKGLRGMILYRDRGFDNESILINSTKIIKPVTINYDNSILQINSNQNQNITKSFLNKLNN